MEATSEGENVPAAAAAAILWKQREREREIQVWRGRRGRRRSGEDGGGVSWLIGVDAQERHPYPALPERRAERRSGM